MDTYEDRNRTGHAGGWSGRRGRRWLLVAAAATVAVAGCTATEASPGAGTTDGVAEASQPGGATTAVGGAGETVQFTVVEHGFEDLPPVVVAGTLLAMVSGGQAEFHEVVIHRLADGDDRTLEEFAALPLDVDAIDAVGNGTLADLGATPIGGMSAPPGAPGRGFMGSPGSFTIELADPGRYLVLDTLPVGADIGAAIDAENSGDYSALREGPYHHQQGEIAIIEVVEG